MSDPILEIRALRKSFGALTATDGVTLDLRPGEIHALIGPNGAGKSTLIKQIVGEIRPDSAISGLKASRSTGSMPPPARGWGWRAAFRCRRSSRNSRCCKMSCWR